MSVAKSGLFWHFGWTHQVRSLCDLSDISFKSTWVESLFCREAGVWGGFLVCRAVMIPGRDHKDPLVLLQFAQHLDVVAEPTLGAAQWGVPGVLSLGFHLALLSLLYSEFCCLASLPPCWSVWGVGNSLFPPRERSHCRGPGRFLRSEEGEGGDQTDQPWEVSDEHGWTPGMQSELSGGLYCSYFWHVSLPSALKPFLKWGGGEGTRLTSLEAAQLSWLWDMVLKMVKRSTVAKLQTVCLELSTLCNPFVLSWVNVRVWSSAVPTRALRFGGDPELHAFRTCKIEGNGFAFFSFPVVLYIFSHSPVKRNWMN